MLSQLYPSEKLKAILLPREAWHPYPTGEEREQWTALPDDIRTELIECAEPSIGFQWPSLPATRFLDFARDGNRSRYEALSFGRRCILAELVLAECVEGTGRFVDDIVNVVWAICEESFWGVPAHIGMQKAGTGLPDTSEPIVDLFAAETAAFLAWTCYLLRSQLDSASPLIYPRVWREMDRRILTPLIERDDFGWMGFGNTGRRVNNWNPWINSNWLTSALIMEPDEDRRFAAVEKSIRSLDNFIDPYPRDGGCDEGPGYWGRAGASLFDCLELLRSATGGALDVYNDSLIQNIGRYIYRVHIADHYFVNFADASALTSPSAAVVYGYGKRIADTALQGFGNWLASQAADRRPRIAPVRIVFRHLWGEGLGRELSGLFTFADINPAEAAPPLPRDSWFADIQVLCCREQEGSTAGFFLAAKGGHNDESHNHNDIGSFIVYADGRPVIVDAGVGEYTARTFSSARYEIWTMPSAYHSLLPTVDGVMQQPGREYEARKVTCNIADAGVHFTLDIAGAYPPAAGITAWRRAFAFDHTGNITITDNFELSRETAVITFGVLTPCDVKIEGNTVSFLPAPLPDGRATGTGRLFFDAHALAAELETVAIDDHRMTPIWGDKLNRVVFTLNRPAIVGTLNWRITR